MRRHLEAGSMTLRTPGPNTGARDSTRDLTSTGGGPCRTCSRTSPQRRPRRSR
jgi:hypothetical protein